MNDGGDGGDGGDGDDAMALVIVEREIVGQQMWQLEWQTDDANCICLVSDVKGGVDEGTRQTVSSVVL